MATNLEDFNGYWLKDGDGYIYYASGTTVPTDATANYITGCIFIDTDASAGSQFYINTGTTSSCAFRAVSASGGAATLGAIVATSLAATSFIKSSSAASTGGIGYSTGAGLAATQSTNKSTTVTNGDPSTCGTITMDAASLAAGTIVSFTFTNAAIAATDVLVLNHASGGTIGSYTLNAQAAAGSATINVRNNTAGALAEAVVIRWALIKAVAA